MNRPRSDRSRARALCDEHARRGDPTGWFEALWSPTLSKRCPRRSGVVRSNESPASSRRTAPCW
ncbi:MAG TPA: hypothetical protein VFC90_05625 [Planctomycetota bacterium]|nr:hypothetical protein [Planctomycetota bacterium]